MFNASRAKDNKRGKEEAHRDTSQEVPKATGIKIPTTNRGERRGGRRRRQRGGGGGGGRRKEVKEVEDVRTGNGWRRRECKANEQFKDLYKELLSLVKWREFSGETIFGGGNALQLYRLRENLHIPVMVLFRYLLDGDNSID
uniref:Uncharacterized protein n=1 Tax=Glossina palpalis gambiensis TaxID=67801 RepID=A0A1B0C5Z9_9MUSC